MGGLAALALAALLVAQDDAWTQARSLPPGPQRAKAFARALEEARGDEANLGPRVQAAFEAWQEEYDSYRIGPARTIAEAMHVADDRIWSAFCLEGSLRRNGEYERADRVLSQLQSRSTDATQILALLERRAIVAAGAGWLSRERDLLGAALARGGSDAVQILGRLELAAGNRDVARGLFRVLVTRGARGTRDGKLPAWGLRGWGLALLPEAPEPLPAPRAPAPMAEGGASKPPRCNPSPPND